MDIKLGSLTLRGKYRLQVFENWVLLRIFGTKKEEMSPSGDRGIRIVPP